MSVEEQFEQKRQDHDVGPQPQQQAESGSVSAL